MDAILDTGLIIEIFRGNPKSCPENTI